MAFRFFILAVACMLRTALVFADANCNTTQGGPNDDPGINAAVGSTTTVLQSIPNPFRTDDQLSAFFKLSDPASSVNYEKYKSTIDTTAQKFGIPSAYLACILKKESAFNPKVENIITQKLPNGSTDTSRSAYGIAEFTDGTRQYLNTIISGRNPSTKVENSAEAIVKSIWSEFGGLPTAISHEDLFSQPDTMIAAAALFFKQQAIQLFGEVSSANLTLSQLQILAYAYNWSPAKAKSACGDDMQNADICSAKLEKLAPKSTRQYVNKMTQCVEPSDVAANE